MCAVAVGIGAVVAASNTAFTVIKLVGAAYLVYLGVQTIRRRRVPSEPVSNLAQAGRRRRAFRQAFVVGVSNPKSTVFFAAVLPQFAVTRLGHVPLQLLVLRLLWIIIALVCDTGWAMAASSARAWLTGSNRRLSRLRSGSGVVMIGLGVALAVSGRPTSG